MKLVYLYTFMMLAGILWSQFLPWFLDAEAYSQAAYAIRLAMTWALAFVMIHVGYEFDVTGEKLRDYAKDYIIAALAAAVPWLLAAAYMLFVVEGIFEPGWYEIKSGLLKGRFAGPSSAGLVLTMMASAGLYRTWSFKKLRVLAIDVDTLLLIIPIKILGAGGEWQTIFITSFITLMILVIWRFRHSVRLPISWYWFLCYGALLAIGVELLYRYSLSIDPYNPIFLEVLLPAFALGSALYPPEGRHHGWEEEVHHVHGFSKESDRRGAAIITGVFMLLVGLSLPPLSIDQDTGELVVHQFMTTPEMVEGALFAPEELPPAPPSAEMRDMGRQDNIWPPRDGSMPESIVTRLRLFLSNPIYGPMDLSDFSDWRVLLFHLLAITFLANLGKMVPIIFYRREANLQERLALGIGLQSRGEEGAAVMVMSLAYGLTGPPVTLAMLAVALNLMMTPLFVMAIRDLLTRNQDGEIGSHPKPVQAPPTDAPPTRPHLKDHPAKGVKARPYASEPAQEAKAQKALNRKKANKKRKRKDKRRRKR